MSRGPRRPAGEGGDAKTTKAPRRRRGGLIVVGMGVVLLLALFLARGPIAAAFLRSWLGGYGVASDIDIRALSLGAASARVRLGDARAPVATVERMDVAYMLEGPWNGRPLGLKPTLIRLVRPVATIGWDGKTLDYGPANRLVQDLLSRPPSGRPPTIIVEAGTVRLTTPWGLVQGRGDARVERATLTALTADLSPLSLKGEGFAAVSPGGPVRVATQGGAVSLSADVPLTSAALAGAQLGAGRLRIDGQAPYPRGGAPLAGPVSLHARLEAERLDVGGVLSRQPAGELTFSGLGRAENGRLSADGVLRATLRMGSAQRGGSEAGQVDLAADLPQVRVISDGDGFAVDGRGVAQLTLARFVVGQARGDGLSGSAQLSALDVRAAGGTVRWRADLASTFAARDVSSPDLAFNAAEGTAAGTLSDAGARLQGRLAAAVAMRGRTAESIVAAFAVSPDYQRAARRALAAVHVSAPDYRVEAGRGWRVSLGAPAQFASTSGARLSLAGVPGAALAEASGTGVTGAGRASLSGGGLPTLKVDAPAWSWRDGRFAARGTLNGDLDAGGLRGVSGTLTGALAQGPEGVMLTLSQCAPLKAREGVFGETHLEGLAGRVCPAGGPIIMLGRGGWTATGRFEAAAGRAERLQLAIAQGGGSFRLRSAGGGAAGVVDIADARLSDLTASPRFTPQRLGGHVGLDGRTARGLLAVATGERPIGTVAFTHDLRTGSGHADIEARGLTFDPAGLQPSALSALAALAREASGRVDFIGSADWTAAGGVTSRGELATANLSFKSPAGAVQGLAGRIAFTSLAPLVTAPGQVLEARSIGGVIPLTGAKASLALTAEGLEITTASAEVAKGQVRLEPMRLPFDKGATLHGALVLDHVSLGDLVAASSLADSVKLDAVVDGRLPFESGPAGLRFANGRIVAVQPGRISIARSALTGVQASGAAAPAANGEVNAVQDFAYQALENLAFDALEATVDSRPGGRLGLVFRIRGRFDPPQRQEANLSLFDVLSGKAFKKRIPLPSDTPIDLNLDTSLNFDELMDQIRAIWSREPRSAPVQQAGVTKTR